MLCLTFLIHKHILIINELKNKIKTTRRTYISNKKYPLIYELINNERTQVHSFLESLANDNVNYNMNNLLRNNSSLYNLNQQQQVNNVHNISNYGVGVITSAQMQIVNEIYQHIRTLL